MQIHDIAIIGAGPCGLAVASRLREPSPSALFTDTEHARFWSRPHDKNTIDGRLRRKTPTDLATATDSMMDRYSMIVFDATSDKWMAGWRGKFRQLKIEELRSPLFFHPDPRDRDGLLGFAYQMGREGELSEIEGVVGREGSKHLKKKGLKGRKGMNGRERSARHLNLDDRDRNDYFTPSAALFDDYIDDIIGRYGLAGLVHHASIVDISYEAVVGAEEDSNLLTLVSSEGETHHARAVVVATGPPSPGIPRYTPILDGPDRMGSASHIFESPGQLIPSQLDGRLRTEPAEAVNVVIVGGGLSSAQFVMLLLNTYASRPNFKVHLILRSKLKVKRFDVDLQWVAKLRNRQMAEFWSADDDVERFDMLKKARGGGSVTPKYAKMLKEQESTGRLIIHRGWEIDTSGDHENAEGTSWSSDTRRWHVVLKPSIHPRISDRLHPAFETAEGEVRVIEGVDHIFFATANPPDVSTLTFMSKLRKGYRVEDVNGLPVLTDDLKLCSDLPLFFTGALAGLKLGPGAGNLAGARLGAERIAWAIEEMFARASRNPDGGNGWVRADNTETHKAMSEVRRDSGYASVDQRATAEMDQYKKIEKVDKQDSELQVYRNESALGVRYIKGIGSRFEALTPES